MEQTSLHPVFDGPDARPTDCSETPREKPTECDAPIHSIFLSTASSGSGQRKFEPSLSSVGLALTKEKPFDMLAIAMLAEGLDLSKNRGDWTPVELFAAQINLWALETRILVSP